MVTRIDPIVLYLILQPSTNAATIARPVTETHDTAANMARPFKVDCQGAGPRNRTNQGAGRHGATRIDSVSAHYYTIF